MEVNNNYNTAPQNIEEEESSIDWAGMIAKLMKCKKFLIIWTVVFAVLGVAFALMKKHTYTATVTLAPEIAANNRTGGLSGIASMLGMGGAQLQNTSDALNITLFPEMVASTPFITDLFDIQVQEYVSKEARKKGKMPKDPTTLYRWVLKKDEPKGLITQAIEAIFGPADEDSVNVVNPAQLTKEQSIAVTALQKSIMADVDKKTGVATISVTMDDQMMCVQLADTVCQRLQRKVFTYRTKKAKEDVDYYTRLSAEAKEKMVKAQAAYAASVDFDRSVILQTISSEKERLQQEASLASQLYQQMEQQKEMAKAKYQELKPVFAVVQPATMPMKPNGTSRKMIVLAFMLVGFVGAAAWKLYAVDYVNSFLADVKGKMNENGANAEA